MRITLFIGALGAGGAERALVVLAEGFQKCGHDVTVLTWINQEADFYHIPVGVKRVRADIPDSVVSTRWYNIVGLMRRLIALRKSIQKTRPDVVISFLDGNNEQFLLASIQEKYRKILSCQNDISEHHHFNSRWEKLREYIYKWGDQIVFLDSEQAEHAKLKYPGWKCAGIPNPLVDIEVQTDDRGNKIIQWLGQYPNRLSAMGRLVNQKGFDMLLESFSQVLQKYPETGLVILGEGELRKELEEQVEKLGIADNVLMPGNVENPHAIISSSEVFVFSSRYEGQGLALLEAMACGVAVVSFDCPSGPSLIINDRENGILVPSGNIDAMSREINRLLKDKTKIIQYSNEAIRVKKKYSTKKICMQWEDNVLSEGNPAH